MSYLKQIYIASTIGISAFCIQDQFLGLARVKTDGLEPDLHKGSIVLLYKAFNDLEKGDVVLLSNPKTGVVEPKKIVGVPKDWIKIKTNAFFIQKVPDGYCWFEDNRSMEMSNKPQEFMELKSLVKGKILYVLWPFSNSGSIKSLVPNDPLLNVGHTVFDYE